MTTKVIRPPTSEDNWFTPAFVNLASDFNELGKYLKSLFPEQKIVQLDLKDLLLEQIFADIYYRDYAGKTFTNTLKSNLNAQLNEVVNQFKSLPSGGAYIVYPRQVYSRERKRVTLVIQRGEPEENYPLELINDYIKKHLDQPIDLDHLEADLEPSDHETDICLRASKYQYFRSDTKALKWPWLITPKNKGELILNILLFRRSNVNKLSELKETAWPSFLHPCVAIKVLRERLGFLALLGKICANRIFLMIIALIGLYFEYLSR